MSTALTTVSAANCCDSTGTKIANATIYFQPCNNAGAPLSFQVGGTGQATARPVSTTVTNGVFSLSLADTSKTEPVNVGYHVTIIDNVSGDHLLGPGYVIQPSGASWSFDDFVPNVPALATIQTGPQGPQGQGFNDRGAWTPSTPYSPYDVYTSSGTVYVVKTEYTSGSTYGANDTANTQAWITAAGISTSAIAGGAAAASSSLTSQLGLTTVNLLNPSTVTIGGYWNAATGQIVTLSGYITLGYTYVAGLTQIVSNISLGVNASGVSFYDVSFNLLSTVPGPVAAGTAIAVPAGAVYMRTGSANAALPATAMIVAGSVVPGTFVPYEFSFPVSSAQATAISEASANAVAIATQAVLTASKTSGINLFNKAQTLTANSAITAATGAVTAVSGPSVTGYMLVAGATEVTPNFSASLAPTYGVAFYDAGLNFISGIGGALVSGTPLPVPANAVYIRMTLTASNITPTALAAMMVVAGSAIPSSYVSFEDAIAQYSFLNDVVTRYLAPVINIFNPNNLSAGLLNMATGAVDSTAGFSYTDYLPVMPQSVYSIGFTFSASNPNYGIGYYDAEKNFISKGPTFPFTVGEQFTTPSNCAFLRVSVSTASASTGMIVNGTMVPSLFVPYVGTVIRQASDLSPWRGKKLAVFGDSISSIFQQQWQVPVCAYLGMTQVFQDARPGRTIEECFEAYGAATNPATPGVNVGSYPVSSSTYTNTGSPATPASQLTAAPLGGFGGTTGNTIAQDLTATAPDLILIFLGTNDEATPVGAYGDAANAGTIWGSINGILTTLTAARPTARIVWIGPYINNAATPAQTLAIVTAIKGACGYFGVPVISLRELVGFNSGNWATFLNSDQLHPNAVGFSTRVAPTIAKQLQLLG